MRRLAFIGAGRMASAIVEGLLRENIYQPEDISCTCGDDPTGPELAARTGIHYEPSLNTLLEAADIVVLACKPQQFGELDKDTVSHITDGKLVLSILAGITLRRLSDTFSKARNIIRSMPNTPGQIGQGVTGYAPLKPLSETDAKSATAILDSLGVTLAVKEPQLDAVTAVSGSGPAYVFEFTAALRAAAEAQGLSSEMAHTLAMETVVGASLLMRESGLDPVELRKMVTSPGGTTQAALESFASDGLRSIIERAVNAAKKRSMELAKA